MSYLNTIRINRLDDKKANRKQMEWIRPTMLNGWSPGPSAAFDDISFIKDNFGFVKLRGTSASGADKVLFILPVGYRPKARQLFAIPNNYTESNLITTIMININGEVVVHMTSPNRPTLSGISFYVGVDE